MPLILVLPRMIKAFNFFQPESGGEARLRLIKESLNLIKTYPLFGSGKGLSVLNMFKLNPLGITSVFPAPVHNFYLLLASEGGLPALLFFFLFLTFIAKENFTRFKTNGINDKIKVLGITGGILASLINSFIHQIFLMGFYLILTFLLSNFYENKEI